MGKVTLLACQKTNVSLTVLELEGDAFLLERLREVGVHPGASLQVVQRLPFQGAHIIRLGEIDVALREEEAKCIWIATP